MINKEKSLDESMKQMNWRQWDSHINYHLVLLSLPSLEFNNNFFLPKWTESVLSQCHLYAFTIMALSVSFKLVWIYRYLNYPLWKSVMKPIPYLHELMIMILLTHFRLVWTKLLSMVYLQCVWLFCGVGA